VLLQPLVASPDLLSANRDRIIARTKPLAPEGLEWNVEVEYGRPSTEITDKAHNRHAQLIVIGHVHHNAVDRILDGDTALEVVRKAHAPVLLTSQDWQGLPKRAVFAVDFSVQSMEAARVALRLFSDTPTIVLAHVRQPVTLFDGVGVWEEEYDSVAKKELSRFAEALNAPAGVSVEQTVLSGNPSAALLEFAHNTDADLIVAGTRGAGLMQRLLVGSVATRLMHHSTRSLLIVPDLKEWTEEKRK
jgi:nucleotide-binding universal stress UspA family protein